MDPIRRSAKDRDLDEEIGKKKKKKKTETESRERRRWYREKTARGFLQPSSFIVRASGLWISREMDVPAPRALRFTWMALRGYLHSARINRTVNNIHS